MIKRSSAAVKALESGNIAKAKEELNEGISLLNNRRKIVKLADKSEFGWATVQEYECRSFRQRVTSLRPVRQRMKSFRQRLRSVRQRSYVSSPTSKISFFV